MKTRCAAQYFTQGLNGTGLVHDVSLTGCRVVGDRHVLQGDWPSIRIFLPLAQKPVEIESARVEWVKGREFGLLTINPSSLGETAIKMFICRIAESAAAIQPEGCLDATSNG